MSARRPDRVARAGSAAAATLFAVVALTGCTTPAPVPAPTATFTASPTAGGSAAPTAAPTVAPTLNPEGTASDNLPLFRAVTVEVWSSSDKGRGRAYVNALVKAGFDKSRMQVTNDKSTVGGAAESLQFSVLWGDECLIGQVGPATGTPVTVVMPALAGGTCLVGETKPINR